MNTDTRTTAHPLAAGARFVSTFVVGCLLVLAVMICTGPTGGARTVGTTGNLHSATSTADVGVVVLAAGGGGRCTRSGCRI